MALVADRPPVATPAAVDSATLLWDAARDRCRPAQANEPAERAWYFRGPSDGPRPRLLLDVTLAWGAPDDQCDLDIAYDKGGWIPIGNVRLRLGPQRLDLSPWVRPGEFRVRLALRSRRPERCWFGAVSWRADGVVASAPDEGWLPAGAWWQPAWAALSERRTAQGINVGAEVVGGATRLVRWPVTDWLPAGDGWRAAAWSARGLDEGGLRALVLAGGDKGAGLSLAGVADVRCDLPFTPLGIVLDEEISDPPPALSVSTQARPDLQLLASGPLELRYVRTSAEPAADSPAWNLRLTAVVCNWRGDWTDGDLAATLTGPDGDRRQRAGYRFPPGPSVASLTWSVDHPLRWRPGQPHSYRLAVEVDDRRALSDRAETTAVFRSVRREETGLWLERSRLDEGELLRLPGPADPTRLAQAGRAGQPVELVVPAGRGDRLAAATLQAGLYEAVVAVVSQP